MRVQRGLCLPFAQSAPLECRTSHISQAGDAVADLRREAQALRPSACSVPRPPAISDVGRLGLAAPSLVRRQVAHELVLAAVLPVVVTGLSLFTTSTPTWRTTAHVGRAEGPSRSTTPGRKPCCRSGRHHGGRVASSGAGTAAMVPCWCGRRFHCGPAGGPASTTYT